MTLLRNVAEGTLAAVALTTGGLMLLMSVQGFRAKNASPGTEREQCARDSHHDRYYDPRDDVTFCTRCRMLWRDADMGGRPSATYTVAHGWRDNDDWREPSVPGGPVTGGKN